MKATAPRQNMTGSVADRLDRLSFALHAIAVENFYRAFPVGFGEPVEVPPNVRAFESRFGEGPGPASRFLDEWHKSLDPATLKKAESLDRFARMSK